LPDSTAWQSGSNDMDIPPYWLHQNVSCVFNFGHLTAIAAFSQSAGQ